MKTLCIQLTVEVSVMKMQLNNEVLSRLNESNTCLWTVRNVMSSSLVILYEGSMIVLISLGVFALFKWNVLDLFVPRVIVFFRMWTFPSSLGYLDSVDCRSGQLSSCMQKTCNFVKILDRQPASSGLPQENRHDY